MTFPSRSAAFAALDTADWKDETRELVDTICATAERLGTFSANELRMALPEDVCRPRIGRCFALARQKGLIKPVGQVMSTDRGTHGKDVLRWEWVGIAEQREVP